MSFPFPVNETEAIVSRWLSDSGFRVARVPGQEGQVRLMGFKGTEIWEVTVEPRSPLASGILAEVTVNGRPDRTKANELWTCLDDYKAGIYSSRSVLNDAAPKAVLSHRESVVCLRAKTGNDLIQFTGFIIDPKGLILTTAHDLSDVRRVTVIVGSGREVGGRLLRTDPERDLALIDIEMTSPKAVPLQTGRDSVGIRERIYTLGCSTGPGGGFHSGVIDGPARRVNRRPLLQADMETLPGGSGSPVFDALGNFIGIVKGRFRGTDRVGFIIPLSTVTEFLDRQ